jgi:hypothetical protein
VKKVLSQGINGGTNRIPELRRGESLPDARPASGSETGELTPIKVRIGVKDGGEGVIARLLFLASQRGI